MIQDIAPVHLDNSYHTKSVDKDSRLVIFKDNRFLLKISSENKTIEFPGLDDVDIDEQFTYLFSLDNEDFHFVNTNQDILCPDGFEFYEMKDLRKEYLYPKQYVFAVFTAYHLIDWYRSNRYCGNCGAVNEHSHTERAMVCSVCGKTVYPRINPAVIVGVTNGDRLLLTKYRTGFAHHALVAGFVEIGETLEETVAREVMEETGLRVKNIRYYKSQPWGVVSDMLVGFYCDVDGDDTIHMDEGELKYAEWVERSEIQLQPLEYSLTNEMMKMFKENKK